MSSAGCKNKNANERHLYLAANALLLQPGAVAAVWQLRPTWKSGSRPVHHSLQVLAPCMMRPSDADSCATQA